MSSSFNAPASSVISAPIPCPPGIPEKFWDSAAGILRTDDLLKSYLELEKRFMTRLSGSSENAVDNPEDKNETTYPQDGSSISIAALLSDDDIRAQILKQLGRPDTPNDYLINHANPYITIDPDLNARLYDLGFTQPQVQAVYDLAVERLVPLILDLVTDQKAEEDMNRLITQFGGFDQWQETARQIQAYGEKHLPADLFETLSSSANGISMLHNLMKGTMAQTNIPASAGTSAAVTNLNMDKLRQLMRDPRYWRDHDPKFVDKVSAGFSRMYG